MAIIGRPAAYIGPKQHSQSIAQAGNKQQPTTSNHQQQQPKQQTTATTTKTKATIKTNRKEQCKIFMF